MPPARKAAAGRKPPQRGRGCHHCRVWYAHGTEFAIMCPHCLTVLSRMEELERDAGWCEKQAADSQRGHRLSCERPIRQSRAA